MEGRAQRGVAPALEPLRIGGCPHQQGGRGRAGTAAQDGAEQVVQAGRDMAPGGLVGGAAQHVLECGRGVRHALAVEGAGGNFGGDCHRRVAPQGVDADAELGQRVGRGAHPRQRMQQMLEAHLRRGMEAGDVVGAVAAGQQGVVDRDRTAAGAGGRRRGAIGRPLRGCGRGAGGKAGASHAGAAARGARKSRSLPLYAMRALPGSGPKN